MYCISVFIRVHHLIAFLLSGSLLLYWLLINEVLSIAFAQLMMQMLAKKKVFSKIDLVVRIGSF